MRTEQGKRSRDVNIHREWVKLWLGIFLTFFGMGIVAYGIIADPKGVIDYSVISAFGVALGWGGAMFGIESHAKIKMHEQEMDYELKRQEQEDEFKMRTMELEEKMRQFDLRYGMVDRDKEKIIDTDEKTEST